MNEHAPDKQLTEDICMSGNTCSETCSEDLAPDVETASENYARRFSGRIGRFFLDRQFEVIRPMLSNFSACSILEVGGGHIQLTPYLLNAGFKVCVHGSTSKALGSAEKLKVSFANLDTVISPITKLPFEDKSFDVVICIRLLCHTSKWADVIKELCRVSKNTVIVDYPPRSSFNCLYPLLFNLKAAAEGNTRTYLRFGEKEILDCFEKANFRPSKKQREFFFPMVMHRVMKRRYVSVLLEKIADKCGLTQLMGSPVMLSATYCIAESLQTIEML